MAGMSNSKNKTLSILFAPRFASIAYGGFFYLAQTASAIDKLIGRAYDLYEKYNLYE